MQERLCFILMVALKTIYFIVIDFQTATRTVDYDHKS